MEELSSGIYERLVTGELRAILDGIDTIRVTRSTLDPEDGHEHLVRHIAALSRKALLAISGDDAAAVAERINLTNRIAEAIASLSILDADGAEVILPGAVLDAIAPPDQPPGSRPIVRPLVPLSTSSLLVNGRDQPRIGSEVQRELASADRVDLLCAFVKWHGLRVIEKDVENLIRRGGSLRVITTTYIGATERRALDRLVELGASVKISYETRTTRLHAKAWLFHRETGFSTGYVGSSNLSKTALVDGLEWNVRISAIEQDHLLDTFRATFDEYWLDPAFESYDPGDARQCQRLDEALAAEHGGPADLPIEITTLEVRPWGYQREILDELAAERAVHGRFRNLVVMATGTGKTVVAALDYRRLRELGTVGSLLFVAHREEILTQSLSMFRHVMRDGSFGERFVGGERPAEWRHVFASVQSLARLDLERDLPPHRFDMVVVDEFHHASEETRTYAELLRHLQPKVLLGLTATPERADSLDVRAWFGGRTAVELRLWEALERGLLAPFQYFGLHDETDLESVRWKRGTGYDTGELTNIYTGHHARTRIILQALLDKVTSVRQMRAIGFCVSIAHAEFMAARFSEAGIQARAVTSRTSLEERRAALLDLRSRTVNILFTVDLFNEGIDLPEIDTVLFLRPTESATVFLQQLGRGLRLADDKPCLTVLDFIGNQARDFRFDLRYQALTGASRRGLVREIEQGFPTLPPGCHIELDRVAAKVVMDNVLSSLRIDWKGLTSELRSLGDLHLSSFVGELGIEIDDIYRRRRGGWAGLRRAAGFDLREPGPDDDRIAGAIGRLLHLDDPERLAFMRQTLSRPTPPLSEYFVGRDRRLLSMLHFSLQGWNEPLHRLDDDMVRLWSNPSRLEELLQLVDALHDRIRRVTAPVDPSGDLPLHVHARYSLPELLAAFGVQNPAASRGAGVKWVEGERADVFWFNLRKTEKHFSPTTMYADRALSPSLFQWESQNATSATSPTGRRYISHTDSGSSVHLFFRVSKEADGDLGAPPYVYAGRAEYLEHTGERPMRIRWKLEHELPADVFHSARVAVG